jgi:capsular polysaccharide biosynthesis protein
MTWGDHARAIAASWLLIVALVAGVAAGAYFASKSSPASYEAATRVAITASGSVVDAGSQIEAVRSMNTGSLVPTLGAIYSAGADGDRIGLAEVPPGYSVSSAIIQQSNVVDVIVTGPDATRVASLADEIARAGGVEFARVYPVFAVQVVRPARSPGAQVGPTPLRDAAAAGAVALGVSYLLALFLYSRNVSLNPQPAAEWVGARLANALARTRRHAPADESGTSSNK